MTFEEMRERAGLPEGMRFTKPFMLFGQIHHRAPVPLGIAELRVWAAGHIRDEDLMAAARTFGVDHSPYEKVYAVPVAGMVRL